MSFGILNLMLSLHYLLFDIDTSREIRVKYIMSILWTVFKEIICLCIIFFYVCVLKIIIVFNKVYMILRLENYYSNQYFFLRKFLNYINLIPFVIVFLRISNCRNFCKSSRCDENLTKEIKNKYCIKILYFNVELSSCLVKIPIGIRWN